MDLYYIEYMVNTRYAVEGDDIPGATNLMLEKEDHYTVATSLQNLSMPSLLSSTMTLLWKKTHNPLIFS